jgi:ribonuclease Z
MVDICLLGSGGMMPLPDRRLSAMLYRHNGKMILVDCGEGTQVSIRQLGWGFKEIDAICLTHYHADHVAGLPGLLLTIGNSNRTEPLRLFGPPGLIEAVKGLTVVVPNLPFSLVLTELHNMRQSESHIGEVSLKSLPLDHHIPCLAYSLEIRRPGRFDSERAEEQGIPVSYWRRLQHGEVIETEDFRYTPSMVLGKERKGLKVVYCTDTRPTEDMADFCGNADLLVLEGIYGEDEKLAGAVEKKHMIFSEAASLAEKSGAKELWLTHYSPSMKDPEEYLDAARGIFANTVAGRDMMAKSLYYDKD